ncbi:MAG: glycosyl transferase [Crocinitomicaceae bacterium]|nr:glycosyl transferase [Crocinitomicaceae bacterium]
MGKRLFDILSSFFVLIHIWPFMLIIAMLVVFSGRGGVFFTQKRVGRNEKEFKLYKFRTMRLDSEQKGQLTVGGDDPRITKAGRFLRRFKLDELPQLLNVLAGSMSVVGPRPEVSKYTNMYTPEQKKVLSVRPGLTDYASIEYIDENDLLGQSQDPEKTYIDEVMPAKLKLNLKYIEEQGFLTDLRIIFKTLGKIIS